MWESHEEGTRDGSEHRQENGNTGKQSPSLPGVDLPNWGEKIWPAEPPPKIPAVQVVLIAGGSLVVFVCLLGVLVIWLTPQREDLRHFELQAQADLPSLFERPELRLQEANRNGAVPTPVTGGGDHSLGFLQELLVPMPEVLRPDLAPEAEPAPKGAGSAVLAAGSTTSHNVIQPAGPWPEDPVTTFTHFCSRCHLLPPADVEPRVLWPAKIRQMYRYATGPRPQPPEAIPPIEAAIAYWTSRAPERLLLPPEALAWSPSPLPFARMWVTLPELAPPPAIACVKWVAWSHREEQVLVLSDMLHGYVILWSLQPEVKPPRIVGKLRHPSRVEVIDLDMDGRLDLIVADLGDFWPVDTDKGAVVWLRQQPEGHFRQIKLMEGLGRVNEVKVADFDNDGDYDLIVACFGNLQTGGLIYLENQTEEWEEPVFEAIQLDDRTGWSDVPVVDWDGDGDVDFFALQSQEHERVVLYWNRGWGSFAERLLYQAPHPRWGSTGIVPVDLDADGDIDLLFNHGDAFQFPPVARPYHGITWLENRGGIPFASHRLAFLPAAHTSVPGDVDGDGDLDILATTFMPGFNPSWPDADKMESVVWLEQISPGKFRRWSIERALPFHAAATLADLDGDGDLDLVVGNFLLFRFPQMPVEATLTIFENARLYPGGLERKLRSSIIYPRDKDGKTGENSAAEGRR